MTISEINELKANEYGLVKLVIGGPNGPRTVAGRITRQLADGRMEIKTQNNGYHSIYSEEILSAK